MQRPLLALALGATVLAALPGCNDNKFLAETPYDFVGPSNFYRTSSDALAAVNGVYASLINTSGDGYYGRNFVMLVEYPTEMVTTYLSATNERSLVDNYTFTPSQSYIYSTWQSAYAAINRANSVIGRVPAIGMDTTLRARVVAEARFLRALNYFNLVRLFGGVPLDSAETVSLDNLERPRATAAEVYDFIIRDLQSAAAALPSSTTYTGSDIGRASRGAARTLLAKVYLQRGATGVGTPADFQSALAQAREVVASGDYALEPNYDALFDFVSGAVQEVNSEVIFDIQNIRVPGLGGRISSHMVPRNSSWGASRNGSFEAEQPFFDSYSSSDKRKAAIFVLSFPNRSGGTVDYTSSASRSGAYGADSPYLKKFLDPTLVTTGQEEPNYIILRYAEVLLMVAEAANEVGGGPTAEAYAAINQVRARAGLAPLAAGLSQSDFRNAVFQERRWELVMEGPNGYFDSQRNWDWARARVEANMALGKSTSFKTSKYPKAQTQITDKFKLMPIPQRAIDLNPKLTQNPGW